jgi:MATE family multidrug resistance protein
MIVGSGFAFAVMPLVAGAATRGDNKQLSAVTRMGLWLSAAYACLVLPIMFWSEALLFNGQDPAVAGSAQGYLRIACWGMFPALFAMVLKSHLSGLERTRIILAVTLMAALFNGVANWVLIFGRLGFPPMGLNGAAFASVIAHGATLGGLIVYRRVSHLDAGAAALARVWRPDWQRLQQVFSLGWPIGITLLAEGGLFAFSAILVGLLGETVLAAHGIAIQLASISFMVHLGLSQVATVRAGQAASIGDHANLRRCALVVAVCSAGFSALAISAFLLAPEFLIDLFLNHEEERASSIVPIAVTLLSAAALFQLADGAQVIALGLLRGVQDTRVPMFMAAFSYWVIGAPAGFFLAFKVGLGGAGVWFGLVIGLGLAAVTLSLRFARLLRRPRFAGEPLIDAS